MRHSARLDTHAVLTDPAVVLRVRQSPHRRDLPDRRTNVNPVCPVKHTRRQTLRRTDRQTVVHIRRLARRFTEWSFNSSEGGDDVVISVFRELQKSFRNTFGRPFVKRFALCYRTCPSVCNVGVLWPNGWMDQDETWYGDRPRPGHIVADGDPSPPPQRGIASPIFGPSLLWPNRWMDKMPLGREVSLGPGDIVLNEDPAPLLKKGHSSPQFSAHVYCGQTAGWIKMPLGAKVGLGPGHIVLDGDSAPPLRKEAPAAPPPIFGLCRLSPNGRPSQLLLSTCPN